METDAENYIEPKIGIEADDSNETKIEIAPLTEFTLFPKFSLVSFPFLAISCILCSDEFWAPHHPFPFSQVNI